MLKLLVQPKSIPWMDFWTSSQRLLQDFFEKSKSNNHMGSTFHWLLSINPESKAHTDTKERFDLVGKCFCQVKVVAFYNKNSRLTLFKGLIY